jgi:tetratricopeptide (TPR) repeat protein
VTALSQPNPHPYVHYLHAAILQKLQSTDYETILSELSLASRSIPGCTLCYLGEAKVYRAQGTFELAVEALEKAVRLDPSFSEAWYHLSIVYARAGRKQDASKASAEFSRLKSEKTNRETELLRTLFLQTMSQQVKRSAKKPAIVLSLGTPAVSPPSTTKHALRPQCRMPDYAAWRVASVFISSSALFCSA